MGNDSAQLIHCFSGDTRRCHVTTAVTSEPSDKGLGHSFCYIRLDALAAASTTFSKVHHSEETTTFRTIFDTSVSANTITSLSTAFAELAWPPATATTFKSSTSFSSVPFQLVPRFSSDPLIPTDRGLLLGPKERGFMSDPLDQCALQSPPLELLPRPRPSSLLALHRCFPPPPPLPPVTGPPPHPARDFLPLPTSAHLPPPPTPPPTTFLWSLPLLPVTTSAAPSPARPPSPRPPLSPLPLLAPISLRPFSGHRPPTPRATSFLYPPHSLLPPLPATFLWLPPSLPPHDMG